jgi:hypothetical protein
LISRAVETGRRDVIILVILYILEKLRKFPKILKHFLSLPTFAVLSVFKATATESAMTTTTTIIIISFVNMMAEQQK